MCYTLYLRMFTSIISQRLNVRNSLEKSEVLSDFINVSEPWNKGVGTLVPKK